MNNTFNENLKKIRENRGWSKKELAAATNVSIKTITGYEMGVQESDFDTLLLLAEILDCSTDDLLGKVKNNLERGYIYIATNPAYPFIKIGYSSDVPQRIDNLSSPTGVPQKFELYATYEVDVKNADISFHHIIDEIDPRLRVEKHKEFYHISPEQAFKLLQNMATIHGCTMRLQRFQPYAKNRNKTTDLGATNIAQEWSKSDDKSTNIDYELVERRYYEFIKMKESGLVKGKTRKVLSEQTGYGEAGIKKCVKIIKEADLNTKQMLRNGEISVNEAYDIWNISFSEMQIPIGSILQYCNDTSITCTVIGEHQVMYEGKCRTLTELAMKWLDKKEGVYGPDYFLFKGAKLRDIKGRQGR